MTKRVYAHPRVWSIPSVRCWTGTSSLLSLSLKEARGAEPLLCQVSSTKGSRLALPPHLGHLSTTRSIHGRCNSKSAPSGNSAACATMLFLENAGTFSLHASQTQIGRGVPQTLSREMHHGGDCLRNSMKRLRGCSK